MSADRVDLVVLGGGPAGLVAAHGAAGLGAEVVMVEPGAPGGDCLWRGCVPSKRLISAAQVAHVMRHTARLHGIAPVEPQIDFTELMARIRETQEQIAPHDSVERLTAAGVRVVPSLGRFTGHNTIAAGDETLTFRKAMIAVGASPHVPNIPGLRELGPLTSDSVWDLDHVPQRLAVIGGGAIGCELGQAFSRLGSTVTIFEMGPHLLPSLDPQIGDILRSRFEAEGIIVQTGSSVSEVRQRQDGSTILVSGAESDRAEVIVDSVLVATGRAPNTAGIDAAKASVSLDTRGLVTVNDRLQTTNPHVFAGGDVVGKMPFTHTAGLHGSTVVANALFRLRRKVDHETIPIVVYCDPEVATIGATDRGDAVVTHRVEHDDVDRAVTTGDPVGFTELFTEDGTLVGATVVGTSAGETIHELALRVRDGASLRQIGEMVRPYPTFAESSAKAANAALRERFFSPKVRRFTEPILSMLDRVDHPSVRERT